MFLVLHPKFSRQQVSASWEFLLGREKTSLLYCFIRDAIDPELKYNKNRKKSQETADKIGEKSEIKVSARGERTLRLKENRKIFWRERKILVFESMPRSAKSEVQVNTDVSHPRVGEF